MFLPSPPDAERRREETARPFVHAQGVRFAKLSFGLSFGRGRKICVVLKRTCGRPQAQTVCVVQIDPTPIPTRRPSTPASMRCLACLRVTTLPPMTSTVGWFSLIHRTMSFWYEESPCEESSTITSTPAATNALHRRRSFGPADARSRRREL